MLDVYTLLHVSFVSESALLYLAVWAGREGNTHTHTYIYIYMYVYYFVCLID